MKMRSIVLAAMAVACGAAQAQSTSSVTLYGLVDGAVLHTNGVAAGTGRDGSVTKVVSGGIQGSRYGFKGAEDLGGGLKAVFDLENQFSVDTGAAKSSTQAFSRKADVGLAGSFGRVTLGRHTTFSYDVQSDLDPVQFANFNPLGNSGDAHVVNFFNYQVVDGRRDNSIKYTYDANGLSAGAMYAAGEVAEHTAASGSQGLRLGYNGQGWAVHGSYDGVRDAAGKRARGLTLGGLYTVGPVTGYLGLVQVKNDFASSGGFGQKNDVKWIGVRYAATNDLAFHAGYYWQKQSDTTNASGVAAPTKDGKAKTLSLLADYNLSKRTDVYAAFQHTGMKDGMVAAMSPSGVSKSVNTFMTGIRTKF